MNDLLADLYIFKRVYAKREFRENVPNILHSTCVRINLLVCQCMSKVIPEAGVLEPR